MVQNNLTVWQYTTTDDTLATVEGSGYFADSGATDDLTNSIKVGDYIFVTASDASALLVVTAVGTITTSVMTAQPSFKGTVTWSGSGASLAATVTGVATNQTVMATIKSAPTQAAYLVSADITAANTITFVLSAANTSNNAVIAYTVF